MSELFRSPAPFSFVDCSTHLSLGLFLFLVCSSSWQGSHNSGITNILGSLMKSGFTSQLATVASGPPYRDNPLYIPAACLWICLWIYWFQTAVVVLFPHLVPRLGTCVVDISPRSACSSSLTHPPSMLFPQALSGLHLGWSPPHP